MVLGAPGVHPFPYPLGRMENGLGDVGTWLHTLFAGEDFEDIRA